MAKENKIILNLEGQKRFGMIPEGAAFIDIRQLEDEEDEDGFRYEVNKVTTSGEEMSTKNKESSCDCT